MTLCDRCKREMKTVPSLDRLSAAEAIRAMKLASGMNTDAALASFIGRERSTIAQWRRRGAIPEAATIDFTVKVRAAA